MKDYDGFNICIFKLLTVVDQRDLNQGPPICGHKKTTEPPFLTNYELWAKVTLP